MPRPETIKIYVLKLSKDVIVDALVRARNRNHAVLSNLINTPHVKKEVVISRNRALDFVLDQLEK